MDSVDKSLDYKDMSVDENEDISPTEIGQILDELTDGFEDPTLLRLSTLSEEDVALDMDSEFSVLRMRFL